MDEMTSRRAQASDGRTGQIPADLPPVGLVVVTHGGTADCLVDSAAGIFGALPAVVPVSISMDEDFDGTLARVARAAETADQGAGIVLLVDLQGSSPFQACMAMLDGSRPAEVVCGVNLPMLLKLASVDRRDVRPMELAEILRDAGKRAIRLGTEMTGRVVLGGEVAR